MSAPPILQAVVQQFSSAPPIKNPPALLAARLEESGLLQAIKPGQTVALAIGSRGINQLAAMVARLVQAVRERGGKPFILPAMGSHGGGDAGGQRALLAHLGVTEATCGAPVVSSMKTVTLSPGSSTRATVVVSADALAAGHVIPLVRVKAHTTFQGAIESGLLKMLIVGLGKEEGARSFHLYSLRMPYLELMESLASAVMARISFPAGVAVLEDATGGTSHIEVVGAHDFKSTDRRLLARYKESAPELPFDEADLLIVERIGKNISGTSMDTNVIGRSRQLARPEYLRPRIVRIWARSLCEASEGNANGVGLADFVSAGLMSVLDREATVKNALSSLAPEHGALPPVLEPERMILAEAFRTAGVIDPCEGRVAWILDTSHLDRLLVSPALASSIAARVLPCPNGKTIPFNFNRLGNLASFETHWRLATE